MTSGGILTLKAGESCVDPSPDELLTYDVSQGVIRDSLLAATYVPASTIPEREYVLRVFTASGERAATFYAIYNRGDFQPRSTFEITIHAADAPSSIDPAVKEIQLNLDFSRLAKVFALLAERLNVSVPVVISYRP